jgi:hypothetical protein
MVCELGLTTTNPVADFSRFTIPMDKARSAFSGGFREYLE